MKEEIFITGLFIASIIAGAGMMFFPIKAEHTKQEKTIANLEAEAKSKPVVTLEGLGICQVTQGGKVYMLVDITEEMQANQATDEIGLEEKHNQLMESYGESK